MWGFDVAKAAGKAGRLLRNERGNILLMTAVGLPVLIGAAGLGTDTVQWYLWKRQVQQAVDSGALAGAYALAQGNENLSGPVSASLSLNDNVTRSAPTISRQDVTIAGQKQRRVTVAVTTQHALPFSSMFLPEAPVIRGRATAAIIDNGEHCIISLEKGTESGIEVGGNATVNLGCGVATNSRGDNAIDASGSSRITATPVTAVGNIPPSSNINTNAPLQPFSIPQADPFEHLTLPSMSNCKPYKYSDPKKGETVEVDPGCYKNGMDLKGQGTIILKPGIYILDGGVLSFGSQVTVTDLDKGVTFILTSSTAAANQHSIATVDANAGADIRLTATRPSHQYEGILFFQDPRAPLGGVNKINGGATSKLQGALYFPNQTLEFTGGSGANVACLKFVARRVEFRGNTDIQNKCPPNSGVPELTGRMVALVE